MRAKLFIAFMFGLFACTKVDIKIPFPVVSTMAPTDNSAFGVTFNAKVENLGTNTDGVRMGFVWSRETITPVIEKANLVYVDGIAENGTFHSRITHDLPRQIQGVRAFVQTKDYVVYGMLVDFNAKGAPPPVITSISPTSGPPSTQIVITGKNFWVMKEFVSVWFDYYQLNVVSCSPTQIIATIPSFANGQHRLVVQCDNVRSTEDILFKVE